MTDNYMFFILFKVQKDVYIQRTDLQYFEETQINFRAPVFFFLNMFSFIKLCSNYFHKNSPIFYKIYHLRL